MTFKAMLPVKIRINEIVITFVISFTILFANLLAFSLGLTIPFEISLLFFSTGLLFIFRLIALRVIGPLSALCLLVYFAPFLHLYSYLGINYDEPHILIFGLHVNQYMLDPEVIKLTTQIGNTSIFSAIFSICAYYMSSAGRIFWTFKTPVQQTNMHYNLNITEYFFVITASIALSWLSAPRDTILTVAYTESSAILDNLNFSSAWFASYALLLLAFNDYLYNTNIAYEWLKKISFYFAFGLIVIFFQLARGDRESLTMVASVAFCLVFFAPPVRRIKFLQKNWALLIICGLIFLFIANIVGTFRSLLPLVFSFTEFLELTIRVFDEGLISFHGIFKGTWTAVLLGPISIAGDYFHKNLEFALGRDYIDMIASLPPGFISDAFGYVRPWSNDNNPAWELTYGIGGWHATVLPFLNFGIVGVAIVTGITFYAIRALEGRVSQRMSYTNSLFLLIFLTAYPHWIWYGEKALLNALIYWLLLVFFLRIRSASKSTALVRGNGFTYRFSKDPEGRINQWSKNE
jgi:hypothetical protein